jgi:hypothetical protein
MNVAKSMPVQPIFIRISDARGMFGVSRSSIYEMHTRGEITIHKRGKTSLLKVDEMVRAIEGKNASP